MLITKELLEKAEAMREDRGSEYAYNFLVRVLEYEIELKKKDESEVSAAAFEKLEKF